MWPHSEILSPCKHHSYPSLNFHSICGILLMHPFIPDFKNEVGFIFYFVKFRVCHRIICKLRTIGGCPKASQWWYALLRGVCVDSIIFDCPFIQFSLPLLYFQLSFEFVKFYLVLNIHCSVLSYSWENHPWTVKNALCSIRIVKQQKLAIHGCSIHLHVLNRVGNALCLWFTNIIQFIISTILFHWTLHSSCSFLVEDITILLERTIMYGISYPRIDWLPLLMVEGSIHAFHSQLGHSRSLRGEEDLIISHLREVYSCIIILVIRFRPSRIKLVIWCKQILLHHFWSHEVTVVLFV